MARYFTLREAEELLPQLEGKLRHGVEMKSELARQAAELEGMKERVAMAGGVLLDQERFSRLRSRIEVLAKRLKELIEQIHASGCQVKDLDTGVLDFPTLYRGEEVMLCWRLGEPRIGWWHGVQDGFRGRKEIGQDFLDNHRGEAPS